MYTIFKDEKVKHVNTLSIIKCVTIWAINETIIRRKTVTILGKRIETVMEGRVIAIG